MTKNSKIIYFIILFSLIFQIVKFYSFYSDYSEWQYVDWLINYQGGFVRRGFVGEFLYQIHNISKLALDLIILFFVTLLFFLLSFFLIKSVKYIEHSYINILIFLSPGFFIYPIMNSQIIGRKDILFLLVIGFFVFFDKIFKNNSLLFAVIFSIFLLCLSHAAFLFYTPYLFFLFFLIKASRKDNLKIYEVLALLITILFVFFLIYFNQGNPIIVSKICNSVSNFVSSTCENEGQLFWLGNNAKSHISVQTVKLSHFFVYLTSLFLVYFFIFIKLFKSKFKVTQLNINKCNPSLIIIFLFLFTLPVYYLGSDWGRYIFISYSGSFFIFIFCIKEKLFLKNYELKIRGKLFIILVLFYSFSWTFPFYHAEKFKLTLQKPLMQINSKVFNN